jgi:hypothetical protein
VPGVVELGVVVLHGTDQRVLAQRRAGPQRPAPGQVPVPGEPAADREGVVQGDPGAGVRAFPDVVLQRIEELHRPGQVRRQPGDDQAAFPQRLPDQREVEHLEIAQPAVDEFAGAARRAGGEVAGLDQADGEAAGDGVERRPRSDHSAADHQEVELGAGQSGQRRVPVLRGEGCHDQPTSTQSRVRSTAFFHLP